VSHAPPLCILMHSYAFFDLSVTQGFIVAANRNENLVDGLCISKPGTCFEVSRQGCIQNPVLLDRLPDKVAKEYLLR